jgi:biotin synthase
MDIREIQQLTEKVLSGKALSRQQAMALLPLKQEELPVLFSASEMIRRKFRGNQVSLCSITSAKSGDCPENCAFCSQSSHHNTVIATHPLLSLPEILIRAEAAFRQKADRFCIVISGRGIESEEELETICQAISLIRERYSNLNRDASLGSLTEGMAQRLKAAGLERYNHNLETTRRFFPSVCTTHTYDDRLKTIRILKKIGIEVCCGGIFGLGETPEDRIEFAFTLKDLDVDCLPLNFLNPIPGTRFADNPAIEGWELLKMIAIYRFILPEKEIRICGGRQKNLGDLQSRIFSAGADAIISGDYLTTKGTLAEKDIEMIHSLGLEIKRE